MDATDSTQIPGLAVRSELCFPDWRGKHNRSLEKHRRKLLGHAAPLLRKVLEEGEEVLFVTALCSPYSFIELLTSGWLIGHLRAAVLVLTDRRLLHLPTTGARRPKGSIAEVRYGDIAAAKVKGWVTGKLALEYRGGGKETFTSIPMFSIKQLRNLLAERAGRGPATANGGRRFLCPGCRRVLPHEPGRCAGCGMEFRGRKQALMRSLWIPGGGYFYTGHPFLGLADAAVEVFLFLFAMMASGLALAGEPEMLEAAALFGGALAVEKLITVYHATHYVKEFLPVDRKAALLEATEASAGAPAAATAPLASDSTPLAP